MSNIQESTRVTNNTSSLLDHILSNAGCKISQKRVIDIGLTYHELIYCTRKLLRTTLDMIIKFGFDDCRIIHLSFL